MADLSILVTGATGYIGGSVVSQLLGSTYDLIKRSPISAVVRREDQAKALKEKGVNAIIFRDLDDSETLMRVASEHDVVIHTASGFHPASAKALVLGLGQRKQRTGKDVYYIHTSGTSNVADHPITGSFVEHENRVFTDKHHVYAYEQYRESVEQYSQRTTDLVVVETAKDVGVKTYIIMSPTIYGTGSGLFNTTSVQIPLLIHDAIKVGQAEVIGKGDAIWDHVHIADLALLYELVLYKLLSGEHIPSGDRGIYFSATGEHTWLELSDGIARAGVALGALKTTEVKNVTLEDFTERVTGRGQTLTELGFASQSRTRAHLGRELGWTPRKTKEDFKANFKLEFEAILNAQRK